MSAFLTFRITAAASILAMVTLTAVPAAWFGFAPVSLSALAIATGLPWLLLFSARRMKRALSNRDRKPFG